MEPSANIPQQEPSGRQWQQLNQQNRVYIMPDFCRFSLPYREPETAQPWVRINGNLTYQINPLQYASEGQLKTVWPYGKYARLLLIYLTTQARRNPNNPTKTISLPDSLKDLMRQLHIERKVEGQDYRAFRNQLDAIGGMQVTITEDLSDSNRIARQTNSLSITRESYISWRRKDGDNSHINGYLQITDETWAQMQHGIPLDDDMLEVMVQMNPTSHGQIIDIYMWLSRRLYALNHSNALETDVIPWGTLQGQFGSANKETKEFTRSFKQSLNQVARLWPGLHYEVVPRRGIILKRSRLSVKPKSKPTNK